MAYNRLNLKKGDVLEAEHIKHLEDGIEGEIIELDQNSDLGEFVYAEDNIAETSVAAHYVYSVDGEDEDIICRYIGKAQPRTDDEVGFRFLDAKHIRIVTVWFKNGDSAQELEFTPLSMSGHSITLGLHTDGLLYVFIDDVPVGNGIALPSGGASGDVVGNIDSEKNIILSGGNIIAGEEYSFYYTLKDGSTVLIGSKVLEEVEEPETPTVITYTVTNNLIACKTSNEAETVNSNAGYQATITPDADAEPVTDKKYVGITAIIVKMGGVDISSTAVSGSNINIPNVTGNIEIYCIGYKTDIRLSLSGGGESSSNATGVKTTGFIPVTKNSVIRIKNIAYSGDTTRGVVGYDANFTKLTTGNGVAIGTLFKDGADANGVCKTTELYKHTHFNSDSLKYIRLCSTDINANSILTVDQKIV